MRKRSIQTARLQESKRKKVTQMVIVLVIVFLMVFSVFGYIFGNQNSTSGNTVEEYGIRLYGNVQKQVWETTINDVAYQFYLLPSQVSTIPSEEQVAHVLQSATTFALTIDPALSAESDLQFALQDASLLEPEQMTFGVLNETVIFETAPVITCADATVERPVIQLAYAQTSEIIVENESCILVNGIQLYDIISGIEKLRYIQAGLDFSANESVA